MTLSHSRGRQCRQRARQSDGLRWGEFSFSGSHQQIKAVTAASAREDIDAAVAAEISRDNELRRLRQIDNRGLREEWSGELLVGNGQPGGMALRGKGIEVAAMQREKAAAAAGVADRQIRHSVAVEIRRCHR